MPTTAKRYRFVIRECSVLAMFVWKAIPGAEVRGIWKKLIRRLIILIEKSVYLGDCHRIYPIELHQSHEKRTMTRKFQSHKKYPPLMKIIVCSERIDLAGNVTKRRQTTVNNQVQCILFCGEQWILIESLRFPAFAAIAWDVNHNRGCYSTASEASALGIASWIPATIWGSTFYRLESVRSRQ